jgi:ABC-2 type transport system ATP-binding protein
MDLRLPPLRDLRRRPRRLAAAVAAVVVLAGAGTWTAVADDKPAPVHREDQIMALDGVRIDTSYFTSSDAGRRPAAARKTCGNRPRSWPGTGTRY